MSIRVAVAGASGYAGGELLRLLLGHPQVEVGAVTAAGSAGSPLREHQPQLVPLADRILEPTDPGSLAGHDVVVLALPHGASAALVAALPPDDGGRRLRCRLPARRGLPTGSASTAPPMPGTWPYGLPELPCRWAAPARGPDRRAPDRRSRLLPDRDRARARARLRGRAGRAARTWSSSRRPARPGAGRGAQAAPARLRGDGLDVAVRRGRRAPAHPGDRAVPAARPAASRCSVSLHPAPRADGRAASSRPAPPGCRPGVDEARLRAAWLAAYADEPFVHVLPDGQWPRTADTLGANVVHLQLALDEAAGRVVVVAAIDNLTKGTGGAAVQCLNLALGLPEGLGPPVDRARAVSVTAAGRLPGRRGRRRAEVDRRHRRRAGRQRRPDRGGRGRASPTNRCQAHPVLWSRQVVADGVVRAVVLNSGGANCYTGPQGFQTTHAHRRARRRAARRLGPATWSSARPA